MNTCYKKLPLQSCKKVYVIYDLSNKSNVGLNKHDVLKFIPWCNLNPSRHGEYYAPCSDLPHEGTDTTYGSGLRG